MEHICKKCGKCCHGTIYSVPTDGDLLNWKDHPEILKFVKNGHFWMDPLTGKMLESCPWLENNLCKIHEIKPEYCSNFPAFEGLRKKYCGDD